MNVITPEAVTLVAVSPGSVSGSAVEILNELKTTNYLLTALIFITLFIWLEKKLKNITKAFVKH